MDKFDASVLTDDQLTECLFEMRKRGAAVPFYDVAEFITMSDGWENQPTIEQVEAWFDRDHLEEIMCDAVRDSFELFLGHADDADYDDDGNLRAGVDNV